MLLDGANLCTPTVLDRLNPLLEPGGSLYLNECGSGGARGPRVLLPHPNFRLFLALDPRWAGGGGCCTCVTRAVCGLLVHLRARTHP